MSKTLSALIALAPLVACASGPEPVKANARMASVSGLISGTPMQAPGIAAALEQHCIPLIGKPMEVAQAALLAKGMAGSGNLDGRKGRSAYLYTPASAEAYTVELASRARGRGSVACIIVARVSDREREEAALRGILTERMAMQPPPTARASPTAGIDQKTAAALNAALKGSLVLGSGPDKATVTFVDTEVPSLLSVGLGYTPK